MKSVNKQMAQQKRLVILFCKNNFNFFIVLVYLWHVLTDVEIKKLLLEIFFHEYFFYRHGHPIYGIVSINAHGLLIMIMLLIFAFVFIIIDLVQHWNATKQSEF
jgi:hypothetical protein